MDVTVIIVTYNSAGTIGSCLASLRAQEGVEFAVVVVDNASTDGTVDEVRRLGAGTRLVANQENVGFGRANNQGFATCASPYVYLLNPDAQLTQPDGLKRLRAAMQQHPNWGLTGTRVVSINGGNESKPAQSYPGQKRVRRDFSRLPGTIAWVIGSSMFFRSEVYQELGGFDPDFFLYNEETDICLRARQKGYAIGHVEDVEVKHIGGHSERGSDAHQKELRRLDGLHLFWQKHYSKEDMVRLAKLDKWRAGSRMIGHSLLSLFQPPGSSSSKKRRYYRTLWESSTKFLNDLNAARVEGRRRGSS